MATKTFDEMRLEADRRHLIRKVQKAMAFVFRKDVELPTSLFDPLTGNKIDLLALGGLPVGMVTPDGYKFGREAETADVDAMGYGSSARSDTTKVLRSISFTPLEKGRKHMQELTLGQKLDGVLQDKITGEIVIKEVDLPIDEEWRLLIVGSDGPADNEWIMGRGYPNVKLSSAGEEAWGTEGAVTQELSFKVSSDEDLGTPTVHYLGGTGALKANLDLGFTLTV